MRRIVTLCAIALLNGCMQPQPWHLKVDADVETEAVNHSGDAADDPALWVNFADPEKSLILGTQKKQGLYSYDLSGNIKQFIPAGRLNNVDIRQNVAYQNQTLDVVAASNRSSNDISVFLVDKVGKLEEWQAMNIQPSAFAEVYGFCMGYIDEQLMFVVTGKDGDAEIYQWDEPTMSIQISRKLSIPTQSEGCVVDDETGDVYIGEEAAGVWRFNFKDSSIKQLVVVADGTVLKPDVEGLALIRHNNQKYLMVSSQGNSQFPVYAITDNFSHVKSVLVVANDAFDKVSGTDGIDVNQLLRSEQFPHGIFMAQDDKNTQPKANQNFKVLALEKILKQLQK